MRSSPTKPFGRRPSARQIRDSHAVVGMVRRGEVTPRCKKAKRSAEIASEYPFSAVSLMEEQERRIAGLRPRRRQVMIDEPEFEPESEPDRTAQEKEVIFQLLFGQAAPVATQVFSWCKTPVGQRVVGVTGLAALALAFSS